MASKTGYKTERWGVSGNATQNANQPLGTNVSVAGSAFAVIDGTTRNLKDAAGTLGSTDICLGLIHSNKSSSNTPADTNAEIETGSFFLPFDVAPVQSNVGATVYISGEQQCSLTAASRPAAGVLVFIDPEGIQYGGGYAVALGQLKGLP